MKLLCLFVGIFASVALARDNVTILIKMIPAQEKFFRTTILKTFEEKNDCRVKVATFADDWDLVEKLSKNDNIDVVKVPMGMAHPLVKKGLVKALEGLVSQDEMQEIRRTYFLLNLARVEGTLYYVPRKFETRIMAYRKSRVEEAVAAWPSMRSDIGKALKETRGSGLPAGYTLESAPSEWDYLDIFVVGYVWATTEYDGAAHGRIAHRGKEYSGTAVGLFDRCYQMGASKADIFDPSSKPFTEVLMWESLYAAHDVYNSSMWEEGWSGSDIWGAFDRGDVFLSYMTQIDCYHLVDAERDDPAAKPQVRTDLAFAVMPKAVSVDGAREGSRAISTGGWLWGIGAECDRNSLAVKLIRHITSYDNQLAEGDRFGIIPVRRDILGKASVMFSEPWKTQVFATSMEQLKHNGKTSLPYTETYNSIERAYIDAWKKVVQASAAKGYLGGKVSEMVQ